MPRMNWHAVRQRVERLAQNLAGDVDAASVMARLQEGRRLARACPGVTADDHARARGYTDIRAWGRDLRGRMREGGYRV